MSTPDDPATARRSGNGRRTALIIVLVAFVASATTAMLAFTASHRAQKADAAALVADQADLRAALASWKGRVSHAVQAAGGDQAQGMLELPMQTESLAAWKPRTPCGAEARDRLSEAMHARIGWLEHRQAGDAGRGEPDEESALTTALRQCALSSGVASKSPTASE